jgi:hypothetical protein
MPSRFNRIRSQERPKLSYFQISKDGRRVINYSQWRSVKDIEAMRQNPDVGPYMQRVAALAKFEAIPCEVSYVHHV